MASARSITHDLYAHDPTYLWKLILRSLSILLALISTILFAWAMSYNPLVPTDDIDQSHPYPYIIHDYSQNIDIAGLTWSFITLGCSIIWSCANIITVLARKGRYVHPVANVVIDLLLWLAMIWTSILAFAVGGDFLLISEETAVVRPSEDNDAAQLNYYPSPQSQDCAGWKDCSARDNYLALYQHKGSAIVGTAILSCVVILFHFALFVSACRYTHARRHGRVNRDAERVQREKYGDDDGAIERAEVIAPNDESESRYHGERRDASPHNEYYGSHGNIAGDSDEVALRVQDV